LAEILVEEVGAVMIPWIFGVVGRPIGTILCNGAGAEMRVRSTRVDLLLDGLEKIVDTGCRIENNAEGNFRDAAADDTVYGGKGLVAAVIEIKKGDVQVSSEAA
jgi:hypothetical protein